MRTATRLSPSSSTIGTGDALDQLQQDHRRVEALLTRAALVPSARRLLVEQIAHALTVHAQLEEDVVYPAIRRVLGDRPPLIDRSIEEHDEVKALLAKVIGGDGDDGADLEDLRCLALIVQQHVAVEEGEIFPAYRTRTQPDDLSRLNSDAERARASASRMSTGDDGDGAPAKKASSATKSAVKKATTTRASSARKPSGKTAGSRRSTSRRGAS